MIQQIVYYIHNTINIFFLVYFFSELNINPITYKIGIFLYLVFLIIVMRKLINIVLPTNNTLLISSITVYIQMLMMITVLFCDTRSNNLNKTVY